MDKHEGWGNEEHKSQCGNAEQAACTGGARHVGSPSVATAPTLTGAPVLLVANVDDSADLLRTLVAGWLTAMTHLDDLPGGSVSRMADEQHDDSIDDSTGLELTTRPGPDGTVADWLAYFELPRDSSVSRLVEYAEFNAISNAVANEEQRTAPVRDRWDHLLSLASNLQAALQSLLDHPSNAQYLAAARTILDQVKPQLRTMDGTGDDDPRPPRPTLDTVPTDTGADGTLDLPVVRHGDEDPPSPLTERQY